MTETQKADAPQPQAELSEDQLDAAVGGFGSLADGRYTLSVRASNVTDGTSNTLMVGEYTK